MTAPTGVQRSRRRGRRLRATGRALVLGAKVLLYGGIPIWVLAVVLGLEDRRLVEEFAWVAVGILAAFVVLGVALAGILLERRGERYLALTAAEAMALDPRPPVLYLRSFSDEPGTRRPRTRVGNRVEWDYTLGEEDYLREALRRVGPFVAVGHPGDQLPQLGAHRFYLEDTNWRAAVADLMTRSAAVVIRLGPGEGLWWELREAMLRLPPERLLFVLPHEPEAYAAFKAGVDPYLPVALPALPTRDPRNWLARQRRVQFQLAGFLSFAPDWSGRFAIFDLPDEAPGTVLRCEFERCLAPFVTALVSPSAPPGGQRVGGGTAHLDFATPPNWPPPPAGWVPPPDWQPDPSWPPAPQGWRFWIPR